LGGRKIAQKCSKCGAENPDSARFCSNCGAPLKKEADVKNGNTVSADKKKAGKIDSFYLLGAAFLIALIIVLLILNANRKTEIAKLENVKKRQGAVQQNNTMAGQPSMEAMQKIQDLKKSYQENPNDYEVAVQLGNSYFDIGSFDKAIQLYRKAISLKKASPEVLIDLGVAYFNSRKADSALFYIKEALQVRHDHPQGLYNLGIIYYNMDKKDKALETWQRLVDHHPDSREAQAAKNFIQQIKNR